MASGFAIAGGLCALLTLVCYFLGYRRSARRYDIIREVPTIQAKDLPGLGAAMVEVKGETRIDPPVISDLARLPCVAFECAVTEHWTTRHTRTDSKGRRRRVTKHHSETRYSNSVQATFQIRDASGEATVRPEGASIDLLDGMELASIREPRPESPAYGIHPRHGGSLHYREEVLPVGLHVYVLGQVNREHAIARPEGVKRPFVISYRSEESLLNRARWGKRIYGTLTVLLFLVSFVLLGIGLGMIENPDHWGRPGAYHSYRYHR